MRKFLASSYRIISWIMPLGVSRGIRGWCFRFDLDWGSTEDLSQFSFTESFVWGVNISRFLAVKP
uniref:Uncharacterized protein n=1 Tax=Romanomermis culicivorax TaxID=13658 RepID=A0A915L7H8_ROMCU